ncbi:MAG: Chloramphenicol phosphotransferase family protein [Anaerocolumna sp.]|jgi:chloramphenicol 3-O phosphotransferase|nr:Chloramphenicol phosphotransferase family protein [Anaerocolumna sp.]
MYHTIKTYTDMGLNVIVDHVVLNQDDGKEQILFDSCINELKNYPITLVKVVCSLEELKRREEGRGDREIGNAEWQV